MMKIVPERNGRKIKKVESCSSNNYTSRKVSTELCPEFFLGQSDDATFCSPYMLALNWQIILFVLTFEVGLEIPTVWGYTTICGLGSILIPGKNFRRNERHHQKSDWFHPQYTYMIWDFPFICINQITYTYKL